MKGTICAALAGVFAVSVAGGSALACSDKDWKGCAGKPWVDGSNMETPLGSKWWPHPIWGAGDEAGSTNWYKKPEVVLRAIQQVKQGKTIKLGHEYSTEMPLFGARKFTLRIPGTPTGGPFGANQIIWHDEFLATEIGQVGTQFDGLGHIGVMAGAPGDKNEMRYYNGFTEAEIGDAYGLKKIGVEKLHPIVARGVLLDIAAARGVDAMKAGEVITKQDVMNALKKQNMENFKFEPGDAIVFRTGWEKHWIKDNATYNDGAPGIGMEVARWIAEEVKAGVTAADTWPVDAVPSSKTPAPDIDPGCAFCVHTYLQTRHGIVNHENLKLSELANAGVYTFMYMFTPSPIKGATGSNGSPVAIY
jgi:kynurenine formamidase